MKKILLPIIVIIIAVVAYFLFAETNPGATPLVSNNSQSQTSNKTIPALPTNLPKSVQPPATPAFAVPLLPDMIVDVKDNKFTPATITVKAGTKITWINNDKMPHTVTSDTGGLLDSKTISPGKFFSHTFTTASTVEEYHCTIHPTMKGTVIVTK